MKGEGNLVNLADVRGNREQRKLEETILSWSDEQAQDLLAITLAALQGHGDAAGLDLYTRAYLIKRECDAAGLFCAGAARLLLGDTDGLTMFDAGLVASRYDPFWLRFAKYAINRAAVPDEVKRKEIAEFETTFWEGFEKESTFVAVPINNGQDRDPRAYLRECAYRCLENESHLVAEEMYRRAQEHLLRNRHDPSAILAKATYHHLMGDPQWCDEIKVAVELGYDNPDIVELGVHILLHEQYATDATRACAQEILPVALGLFNREPDKMKLVKYLNSVHLGASEQEFEHDRHRARFAHR